MEQNQGYTMQALMALMQTMNESLNTLKTSMQAQARCMDRMEAKLPERQDPILPRRNEQPRGPDEAKPVGEPPEVLQSYSLKQEPPDNPSNTKHHQYQGKALHSQRRMKPDLLSLGTDYTVSRSKLCQEGEYDAVIKPVAELELPQTCCSSLLRANTDVCAFHGAYRANQDELGYKSTCSRNSIHQGITEKKNWFKSFPHEEDIQLTTRQTSTEPEEDQLALIGSPRSNQEELGYKPTWFIILTQQRHAGNWNHINTGPDEKVMGFLNQMVPDLPYLEPSEFWRSQTYLWQPGDDLSHLEASEYVLRCTSSQRIRRIQSCQAKYQDFPYLAQESSKDKDQRLYAYFVAIKRIIRRLTSHGIIQKLSRYKSPRFQLFPSTPIKPFPFKPQQLVFERSHILCLCFKCFRPFVPCF